MSLQRCKRETTSTEFVAWREYFARDLETPTRMEYYMAQLTATVARTFAKNPQKIKAKQFLLEFTTNGKGDKPPTEDEIEQRIAQSEASWAAIINAPPQKPPPQKKTGS